MKRGMRVGLWLVVIGLLVSVASLAGDPGTTCFADADGGNGFEFVSADADGVTYTSDGERCTVDAEATAMYSGLGFAALGALLWGGSVVRTLAGEWTT